MIYRVGLLLAVPLQRTLDSSVSPIASQAVNVLYSN